MADRGRGRGRGRGGDRGGRGGRGDRGGGRGGRGGRGGGRNDAQAMAKAKQIPFEFKGQGPLPNPIDLSDQMASALALGSDFQITPTRRPAYCSDGRAVRIMTNHYLVQYNQQQVIYQYDVQFGEDMDRAKMPRKKCWAIIGDMVRQHTSTTFQGIQVAYDGRANIFAANQLPSAGTEIDLTVQTKGRRGDQEVRIILKLVGTRALADVASFLNQTNPVVPQDCFTAMDIVLRNMPSVSLTSQGACFYSEEKKVELSGGADLWFGHYQSLRATQSGLTLNVDTSATAFIRPQPALDYVASLCRKRSVDDLVRGRFGPREQKNISSGMNFVLVSVTHRKNCTKTFKVAGLSRVGADQLTFPADEEGTEKNVASYFAEKYGPLKFPHLPCFRIGSRQKHNYLPMEVCNIVGGQKLQKLSDQHTSDIIRQTCMKPYARNAAIHEQFTKAANIIGQFSVPFGLRLVPKAVAVEGRVLNAPAIGYGKNNIENPRGGSWNLINKVFFQGATLSVWAVVCLVDKNRMSPNDLQSYVRQQVDMCNKSGINVRQTRPVLEYWEDYRQRRASIADVMQIACNKARDAAGGQPPQFILVIKFDKEREEYQQIKVCSDTQLGIACQCVTLRIAGRPNASCLANIALQINAKLGGINSVIKEPLPFLDDAPTIIMGADVNHPGAMNTSKPSVAAVTASMDRYASKHAGVCRVQSHRKEIIQDLAEMTQELLIAFYRRNNVKPQRILFYRDGVGENQFTEVASSEVVKIKEACNKLEAGYSPTITFVIVQKRHHTRLFAHEERDQDRSGNIQPGTIVDTGICTPHGYDFYLCSHSGIQGTSKPTYYYVLMDENGIPPNNLYNLTYKLCYMYTACTRAVSAIPAAFYAHLMAFRGAFYITESDDSQTETTSTSNEEEAKEINWGQNFQAPHPSVTQNMYFV